MSPSNHSSILRGLVSYCKQGTCLDSAGAAQERWLDPDCEYARPIDPGSTHVPVSPVGLSGAGSKAKGVDKPVGPLVTASCTQNGMKGATASDLYTFKGQRVRTPVTNQRLREALHLLFYSCVSCNREPVKSRAAKDQPCSAPALHGDGREGQSFLQCVIPLLDPSHISM